MSDAVLLTISPRVRDLGDGFVVRRVLPYHAYRMVGPFIFFDHFGPVDYAPGQGFDVRPHPHIGLATVTYLFEGAIRHRDSLGSDLVIRPGAVNWMTAGQGIVHSERTPDEERASGQSMHGLQTWVALPKAHEGDPPSFIHHPSDSLPAFDVRGVHMRVLAGEAWGHTSPVRFPWPILYVAFETDGEADITVNSDLADERAIYLVGGTASFDGHAMGEGEMVVLKAGKSCRLHLAPGTKGVICGGAPIDGARHIDWNFVSSDPEAIRLAREEWTQTIAAGGSTRFPAVPGDDSEWIPLP